ncbi:malic enzyme [Candidatus Woesearchaeota archaeon]|jgi:malate dehydrogenase (oxaloacetate-decarboxylating)(NADP+)|nr:malic enzyme [Candidatus Woesearchaeota archaeon]MBT4150886.1 malic enzyme [Candidatus Woesearchaeota archaeon]MBT4247570.1 malic enzyme [Candidatus Woesearchaeota archaeon]MBT4433676.1 malic enzyme [Candidatus Woesearchaeota archaeon]
MKQEALDYHSKEPKGKFSVVATKPMETKEDLALAYTPGVAEPCLEIEKDESQSYEYTSRGNLVGVISNGTAVLGLGNIGAAASKPVMEGKGVLFKKFGNVDFFDIEINETDVNKFIEIVASLEPTFGGINLEDIKAPECFEIEEKLIERMNIPVFHDDQHGTAVVIAAGLINALKKAGKELENVKIVISGAGAAAIAGAKLLLSMGAKKEQIFMFDSKGLITVNKDVNTYKKQFAQKEDNTLIETLQGADVFIGLSKAGLLTGEMVKEMANTPIIFAMANPVPEIMPDIAKAAVSDVIMATGRSDFPNQVNNVLCFPFMFRGAFDVRASKINEEMKIAAVHALAELAEEGEIIPSPFNPNLMKVAEAVAKAAVESGVAQK